MKSEQFQYDMYTMKTHDVVFAKRHSMSTMWLCRRCIIYVDDAYIYVEDAIIYVEDAYIYVEDAWSMLKIHLLMSKMLNLCWSCNICVPEMYRADKEHCIWRRLECLRLCSVVHCVQLVWRFNTLHSTGSLSDEPRGLVSCVRNMWFSKLHDEEPERVSELVWFSKPNVCRRACQFSKLCAWEREAQKKNYVV